METPIQLRMKADKLEREEHIAYASRQIASGLSDLIRSITKGDGGDDFRNKSRDRIADGIADLVKVVTNA